MLCCAQNIDDVDLDQVVIGNRITSLSEFETETEVIFFTISDAF